MTCKQIRIVLVFTFLLCYRAPAQGRVVYSARVPAPPLTTRARTADPVLLAVELIPDRESVIENKRMRLVFDKSAKKEPKPVYIDFIPDPGDRTFPKENVALRCAKKDSWYPLDRGTGPICQTDKNHVDLDLRWTVPYDMEPGVYTATFKVWSTVPFTLYIRTPQGRVAVKARGVAEEPEPHSGAIPDPVNLDGFFTPRGRLVGRLWLDRNGNGELDAHEGLSRVRVNIDHGIPVMTDERGWFIIDGLQPGRHLVWLWSVDEITAADGTPCRATLAPTPVWIHDGMGTLEFFQAQCQSVEDPGAGFWRLYALGETEWQWVRDRMTPADTRLKLTDTRLTLALVGWLSASEVVQLGLNLPEDPYVGLEPRNLPGNLYPVLRYISPEGNVSRYWVGVQMPAMQARWQPQSTGQLDPDLPFRQAGSVMWAEYKGRKLGLRFVAVDPLDFQWRDRIRANGSPGPFVLTQVPAHVEDLFVYLRQTLPGQPDAIVRQDRLPPEAYEVDRATRRLILHEPVPTFTPDGLENWIIVAYRQLQPGQSGHRSYGLRMSRQLGKSRWQLGLWSIGEFRRWGWTLQTRTPLGRRGEAHVALGRVENLDFSGRHPWYGQVAGSYRLTSLWTTHVTFSSYPNFVRTPGWEPGPDTRYTNLDLRNDLQWSDRHQTRWGLEMTRSSAPQWSPYLEHTWWVAADSWLGVRAQSWWNSGAHGSRISFQGGRNRWLFQTAWQRWQDNVWWDARLQLPVGASDLALALIQPLRGDGTRPQVRGSWRFSTRRLRMGLQASYQWKPDRFWIVQGEFGFRGTRISYHTSMNWTRLRDTSTLFTSTRLFWNPLAGFGTFVNTQFTHNPNGWSGYLDTSLVAYGIPRMPYYFMASYRWTRGLPAQIQPRRLSLEWGWLPTATTSFGVKWSRIDTGDGWFAGWVQIRLQSRLWLRGEYDYRDTPARPALERTTVVAGFPLGRDTLMEIGYRWSRTSHDQLQRLNLAVKRWHSGPVVRIRTGITWTLREWLKPRQPEAIARFEIIVPDRAQRGTKVPIRIRALRENGQPAKRFYGRVWLYLNSEPAKIMRIDLPFNRTGEWTATLEIPRENTRGYLWLTVRYERPPYPQGWAGPIQVLDETGTPLTPAPKPERPQAWTPPELRPPERIPQPATFDIQIHRRVQAGQTWFDLDLRVLDRDGKVLPNFSGKIRITVVPEIAGRQPLELDFKADDTGTMHTTLGPIPAGTWVVMVQAVDKPRVVGLSTPITVGSTPIPDHFSSTSPHS